MKPNQLTISAFGPFPNEVSISFEQLLSRGLFLITGDTGAGKTTIFDAISFALFGNASGENRTTDSFRSHYAADDTKTFVTLIFTHKGKRYEIYRNPLYQRAKKKGDGVTYQKPEATLKMPDGQIITGYTQVSDTIGDILGIDFKQFKQIAMIAQGEFLKLLLADSKERSNVFRRVFQTENFEKLQYKLKDAAASYYNQLKDLKNSLVQYLSDIQVEKEHTEYSVISQWMKEPDIYRVYMIMDLLQSYIAEDEKRYEQLEKRNNELVEALIRLQTKQEAVKANNERILRLNSVRQEYAELLNRKEDIRIKKEQVQLSSRALYEVKPVVEQLDRIQTEVTLLSGQISGAKERRTTLDNRYKTAQKVQESMKQVQLHAELLQVEISKLQEQSEKYNLLEEVTIKLQQANKGLNQLQLQLKQRVQEREASLNIKVQTEQKQKELECANEQFLRMEQRVKDANTWYVSVKKLIDISTQILEQTQLRKIAQTDYEKAENAYKVLSQNIQEEELAFLREQAGLLAIHLSEGVPCPVCGSTTHPMKASIRCDAPTQQSLNEHKKELETAHLTLQNSSVSLNEVNTRINMLTKQQLQMQSYLSDELKEMVRLPEELLTSEQLNQALQVVFTAGKQYSEQKKEWQNKKETYENNKAKLESLATRLTLIEQTIETSQHRETELITLVTELTTEQKQYRQMLEFETKEEAANACTAKVESLQQLKRKIEQADLEVRNCEKEITSVMERLAGYEETKVRKDAERETVKKQLTEALINTKLETMEQYLHVLCSKEQIDSIVQSITEYEKDCSVKKSMIQQLETETKGLSICNIDSFQENINRTGKEKTDCEALKQMVYSRIEKNQRIYQIVLTKLKEQEAVKDQYLMISEIAKTAVGELTLKARVTFEQYVQAFYFDRVIKEANKRLRKMTFDQYTLHRSMQADDLRTSAGLDLVVMDHYTGKERSVKSLSGGESFKASLAMALGLSDVIQNFAGGIELDAMFIDEGFGSLDSESLEQAIEILDSLATGNRLIGIISHVNELKERIDKKIIIQKTMEGSSIM